MSDDENESCVEDKRIGTSIEEETTQKNATAIQMFDKEFLSDEAQPSKD